MAFFATVIDCHTKAVIVWAMDDNYQTPLIAAAIQMAARNCDLPPGAIFHSDRGSNYTSADFAQTLKGLEIRQSVGWTGICYENAMAESFNAALKVERVHRTTYSTRKKAYAERRPRGVLGCRAHTQGVPVGRRQSIPLVAITASHYGLDHVFTA